MGEFKNAANSVVWLRMAHMGLQVEGGRNGRYRRAERLSLQDQKSNKRAMGAPTSRNWAIQEIGNKSREDNGSSREESRGVRRLISDTAK